MSPKPDLTLALRPAVPEDGPACGQICYDAFSTINAAHGFPLPVEAEVSYCGYASEKSFGGSSYFVRHPAGNWLIDSPRYKKNPLGIPLTGCRRSWAR